MGILAFMKQTYFCRSMYSNYGQNYEKINFRWFWNHLDERRNNHRR